MMLLAVISGLLLSSEGVSLGWNASGELTSVVCEGVSLSPARTQHTVLFSRESPDRTCQGALPYPDHYKTCRENNFPGFERNMLEAYSPVSLNTAGEAICPQPSRVETADDGSVTLYFRDDRFTLKEHWSVRQGDIVITQTLTANMAGWFSLQSPSLCTVDKERFVWAGIPGYWHSDFFNRDDFDGAYNYGFGLPDAPVVCRERSVPTLCGYVTDSSGITFAAAAAPGQERDPWQGGRNTNRSCRVGVSLQNRQGEFCPTIWHPVLGEEGSYLRPGEQATLQTVFTLKKAHWWEVFRHIALDVNMLEDRLRERKTELSLTSRLYRMKEYVLSDTSSLWRNIHFEGRTIGAQDYLGFVYGADQDAMKNADYGAMWMLSAETGDPRIARDRLPAAEAFKFAQQASPESPFSGAPRGQYFLYKSRSFTEEFGDYTEPVAATYYMLIDLGNIALFEPGNREIRHRIRLAADRLLEWMHPDGHWEVAYANSDGRPLFTDLTDLRPTFYGLVVAYKILGDRKYLRAARTAALWLKENAVDKGCYLGVCGDTRFLPDFATAQCARAFQEMYDITGEKVYLETASQVIHHYATQIFTHSGSQAGLNFEHGATFGSCIHHGPILLASHAGLFVREYVRTRDSLLLDMARLAAWGRDDFVEKKSGVASYYWYAMDRGPGSFPHHAWWQIGWITDYLVSEAYLRSGGKIDFPHGFMAPKVGPHVTYGFRPGRVNGRKARLCLEEGLAVIDNPYIECLTAQCLKGKVVYAILMNNSLQVQSYTLHSEISPAVYSGEIAPGGLEVITLDIAR